MTEHEPIAEEPEVVHGRPIAVTIVLVALTITACVFVVWALQAYALAGGGESRSALDIESIPPAQPFETARTTLERARDDQRVRLDSWTWADRAHRRVWLPVDRALDRYLNGRSR